MGITHSWNGTVLTVTSDSGTSSADLKGAKGDDGVRGAQGVMDYSILSNNYLERKVKDIDGTSTIQIQTRFNAWDELGENRQSIFIFGVDNDVPIYGLIVVNSAGACTWSGVGEITIAALDGGVIEITLPVVAYDTFTVISGQPTSIL